MDNFSVYVAKKHIKNLVLLIIANMLLDGLKNNLSSAAVPDNDASTDIPLLLHIDNESLKQWLQNDWLQQNISQVLNISTGNLTSLSHSVYLHRDPLPLLTTLTSFYALIFVAGILGNLITCIVISRNKFMHTATNFYLFNLAVSDLILLISGMPQEVYNLWYPDSYPFTDALCILESVLSETAANATVLTITAFTVERYIAICHPFRQHTMSKLSRAIKFIFVIWITAFLLALPQAMQFSVEPENGGTSCTMNNYLFKHVFAVSGFIFFCGPMTAICVLYVLIGVKLKRSRLLQAVPRRCYDMHRGISAQSRVIRMLVAVAVAFFLCWAPFHAQRLMAVYGSIDSKIFNDIFYILNYTSGVLYFLSTCINPLLYNIMSHKFREAFKVTLARHFGLSSTKSQGQSHNYCTLIRQNGSMRLNTTVNNNFSSFRVPLHNCRDPSHHLSLQDSLRTTTTTTTTSAGGNGNGSIPGANNNCCRSSLQRNRCISIGSQSTLNTSLGKADVYVNNGRGNNMDTLPQRKQQRQISRVCSLGDARSLLESEDTGLHFHSNHHKELIRYKDSNQWNDDDLKLHQRRSDEETELFPKPVAPLAPLVARQPLCLTPMNSVAELTQPTRSRLKLSRIITRRNQDMYEVEASPRVELMRTCLPGMGHRDRYVTTLNNSQKNKHNLNNRNNVQLKSNRKLNNLRERFRWRTRTKDQTNQEHNEIAPTNLIGRVRHESSSSTSSNSGTIPTTALTRANNFVITCQTELEESELSNLNGNTPTTPTL